MGGGQRGTADTRVLAVWNLRVGPAERFTNPDRFSKNLTGSQKPRHTARRIITNPDTVSLIQTCTPKTRQSPPLTQTLSNKPDTSQKCQSKNKSSSHHLALNQTHHQALIQTAHQMLIICIESSDQRRLFKGASMAAMDEHGRHDD